MWMVLWKPARLVTAKQVEELKLRLRVGKRIIYKGKVFINSNSKK
jgi:hypothetical protein